ncbi:uncharacterized protein PV07_09375 [Cladophialophora immunda]|uniref:Uncharacterized protein n=1 Tax=Cladophialophora immunda TaxID=569365 RepID=A0A0D2C4Z6_9EURO|nr:uncharacterized protein PV07_09375 [Cladophialophora immunda]KIW26263.1 hypothetical protein PV07_09375 [Cladophialophora immunda]
MAQCRIPSATSLAIELPSDLQISRLPRLENSRVVFIDDGVDDTTEWFGHGRKTLYEECYRNRKVAYLATDDNDADYLGHQDLDLHVLRTTRYPDPHLHCRGRPKSSCNRN